jgi:hypothetical protein
MQTCEMPERATEQGPQRLLPVLATTEDMYLKLYVEFHRFMPVIANWQGFRIAEIEVRHHPRTFGVTKFGAGGFACGLIDLLTVLFLPPSVHT